jgi:DMSO/TMAO reductase YedYZ molybdopterin-dependent catalytic subunit
MTSGDLPPGQIERADFPRFGLGLFARRYASNLDRLEVVIAGDVPRPFTVSDEWRGLERVEQVSDFHCVTTWSRRGLKWSGVRFADFYREVALQKAGVSADAAFVVFRAQDGYCNALILEDLLAGDVLLADRVDGEPLGLEHGGPLRLVAPAHYGYKNVKHLASIEFRHDRSTYRFPWPYPRLMDHPRARVALEERGVGLPGWVFRWLYRPLVAPTVRKFRRAVEAYRSRRT